MSTHLSTGQLSVQHFGGAASALPSSAKLREAVLRRELACLLQERDALRDENEALRDENKALREELAAARSTVTAQSAEASCLKNTVAALRASRSWRVTAPARGLSVMLQRLRGRSGEVVVPAALIPGPAPLLALAPPPPHLATPAVAADTGAPAAPRRGEILVVADILPLFDQASGGLRLKTLINMMGDAGWSIIYGSLAELSAQPGVLSQPEGRARYEQALRDAGVTRILYGIEEIDRFLTASGRSLDWAFLSFPHVASDLLPLVRTRCPTARIAYDMVDFHGLRMAREAALRNDPGMLEAAERQRAVEIACATAADVTVAVTAEEKAVLLDLVPSAVVEVLPNIFELSRRPPPGPESRNGLFFVGGFWHAPNGDAVCWFADRIFPLLRREMPNLVFRIAGANPGNEVLSLGARPGIEVLGFVPDLAPLYDRSRVFVAPLRYGAGMKGKVGQSLAHGLPVVATQVGAEGMGLQDGVHVLVAEDEEAFAAQVLQVLRDDGLWSRLSMTGRAHIERTLSVEAVRGRLEALLNG